MPETAMESEAKEKPQKFTTVLSTEFNAGPKKVGEFLVNEESVVD